MNCFWWKFVRNSGAILTQRFGQDNSTKMKIEFQTKSSFTNFGTQFLGLYGTTPEFWNNPNK